MSIITTSLYIALAAVLRKRLQKSAPVANASAKFTNASRNVWTKESQVSIEQNVPRANKRKSTQRKLNKMMAAIFIVYYLSYSLFLIPPQIKAFQSNKYFLTTRLVQNLLYGINAIANPFIYLWVNNHFRAAFKSMIGLKVSKPEFTIAIHFNGDNIPFVSQLYLEDNYSLMSYLYV